MPASLDVRPATHDDYEAVAAFTEHTWPERDGGDYIPRIYHDWIEGEDRLTLVADAGDAIAAIAQCVRLSEHEAWCQGMRVNPEFRGRDVSRTLTHALFDWARERGATVARNMVFSWNEAGLGQSRATGFAPVGEFRWLNPEPEPRADPGAAPRHVDTDPGGVDAGLPDAEVVADPDAAWTYWSGSDARTELGGLGLDLEESWAVRDLTRETFRAAPATLAVRTDAGTRAATYRTRTYEREADDGTDETWAEYGAAAWGDLDALAALVAGIRADAAAVGADRTRVLVPETARHVSDGARLRTGFSDTPDFLLAADLTADDRG